MEDTLFKQKSQSGKNFSIIEIHKKLPWGVLKHDIKLGYNPFCFTSLSLKKYFKNYFVNQFTKI